MGIMHNTIIYSLSGEERCRDIQRQLKHCCEFFRLQLQRLLRRGGHFCNLQVLQARPIFYRRHLSQEGDVV